jgi:UDP-glucose 4-epimerase
MKVLITGVAGFIGSNLAARLLRENDRAGTILYDISGIDDLSYGLKENIPAGVQFYQLDIRSQRLPELFKGIDAVFHLAAKNCIADCQKDPVVTADINVAGSANVFAAATSAMVKKVIYAESSALYEGSLVLPTPETELAPKSFYAASKAAARLFADAYRRYNGSSLTALRYFCAYGPVQDYRRTIPPVMSAFIIKLLKGERPVIYGTGEKRRDFVYIDDVNDFHMKCLTDSRTEDKTFNLGSGVNYSVLEIYDAICEQLGVRLEPTFKGDLPGEAQVTLADISEARKIGWAPKTDLETGLREAIHYIQSEIKAGRI